MKARTEVKATDLEQAQKSVEGLKLMSVYTMGSRQLWGSEAHKQVIKNLERDRVKPAVGHKETSDVSQHERPATFRLSADRHHKDGKNSVLH